MRIYDAFGNRRGLVLSLCVVTGLLAGLAAVGMHALAQWISAKSALSMPDDPLLARWLLPALPALGIFFCVMVGEILFRKHGYDRSLLAAIRAAREPSARLPGYHTFMHILTSGVSVGLGISAGMEAPSALTGSAIGYGLAHRLRLPRETVTLLLSSGAAAGIAAIFGAPLAGTLFACEVLLPSVSAVLLVPILLAAASGMLVNHYFAVAGHFPTIAYSWQLRNIWLYAVAGVCCGLVSWGVIQVNSMFVRLASGKLRNPWLRAALGGIVLYGVFLAMPVLGGQGYNFITHLLNRAPEMLPTGGLPLKEDFGTMLLFFLALTALKPVVSMVSLTAGGDGGMFGPSLTTGAFLGYAFHLVLLKLNITGFPAINCIAAGMAGMLAGVMHAPMTGLFLIAEMLGGYPLLVPLMVVTALSAFISRVGARKNLYFAAANAGVTATSATVVTEAAADFQELEAMSVAEFVDRHYFVVNHTDTFATLLKLVVNSRQVLFPVVDANGKLKGVIDELHIRPFLLRHAELDSLIAEDFMEPVRASIDDTAQLGEAWRIFDEKRISYLPVLHNGRFEGMLSRSVLLDSSRRYLHIREWIDQQ